MAFHDNALIGASNATGGGDSGFKIQRSLRFNRADDSYLSSSFTEKRTTFTVSFWAKRTGLGTWQHIWSQTDGSAYSAIAWANTDAISVYNGAHNYTVKKFRDVTAWYHLCLKVTNGTGTLYVNGEEVKTGTTGLFLGGGTTRIGDWVNGAHVVDGYVAEFHCVDGAALDPTDFGEEDATTGVWNPIEFTGSYGPFGGVALASANGALPILNTSGGHGQTVTSGVRTDSLSANIVLALPLNGSNGGTTITDYHHTVKGSGSAKAITLYTGSASGGAVTSTAQSRYYGSSFYVVRGATNNYTASDYIARTGDTDLAFGTGSFCVEFWHRPGTLVTNSTMFDSRHNSTDWPNATHGFQFYTNTNGDLVLRTGSSNVITASSQLTEGEWAHLAVTGDFSGSSRTIRIYCNGTQVGTVVNNNDFSEGRFTLGSAANNGEGSNGYYADLRIYKGVAKYTSNFTIPEAPSAGTNSFHLDFNDVSSNSSLGTDSSGKNNNWSVTNISSGGPQVSTSAITNVSTIDNTRTISVTAAGWQTINNAVDNSDSTVSPSNNNTPGTITFSPALVGVTKVRAKTRFYGGGDARLYNGATQVHTVSHNNNNTTQYYDIYDGPPIEITQYWQQMNSSAASDDFWALEVNGVIVATNTNGGNLTSSIPGAAITLTTTDSTNYASFAVGDTVSQGGKISAKDANTPSLTVSAGSWSNGDVIDRIPDSDCDSFIDTPTNYTTTKGNPGGNYATLNLLDRQLSNGTLSNGNLELTSTGANWSMYRSTIFVNSGKWYWEVEIGNNQYTTIGIIDDEYSMGSYTNAWVNQTSNMFGYYPYNGQKYNGSSGVNYATGDTTATGSIIGVALDMENGTLTFYKDGTSLGTAYSGLTGKTVSPAHWIYQHSGIGNADIYNFGQRPFLFAPGKTGAPASDFKALCSTNFDDTTIQTGSDYFDVKLYGGTNNIGYAVTGLSFSPDMIWIKNRTTDSTDHILGTTLLNGSHVYPNGTWARSDGRIQSLDSNGFRLASNHDTVNASGHNYVAWCWDAGTVTNPVGDLWFGGATKYIGVKFASASGGTVSYGQTSGSTTVEVWTSSDNSNWTQQGGTLTLSAGHTLTTSDQYVAIRNTSDATFTNWYAAATDGADGHYSSVTYPSGATWSGPAYTDYDWREDGGVINTDGANPTIVRASQASGFSVLHYEGNGVNTTIGHGLSQAPEFFMVKRADGDSWHVYHKSITPQKFLRLNASDAEDTRSTTFQDQFPTSSVVYLGTDGGVNLDNYDFFGLFWHSVDGFCKIGEYTGKGATDNEYIWTGFRPKFIIFKYSSHIGDWILLDTSRRPNGPTGGSLVANNAYKEDGWYTNSQVDFDFCSNGFKIRHTGSPGGDSARQVAYACWAENPFKISRAF